MEFDILSIDEPVHEKLHEVVIMEQMCGVLPAGFAHLNRLIVVVSKFCVLAIT